MRLLFVVNVAWFFRSHRLPLAVEASRRGFEVHLASAFGDDAERRSFEQLGIATHEVSFERSSTSPLAELGVIARLFRVYRHVKPSICHHVSIKPVIYGGLLSRMLGVPAVVNAISGLGFSYIASGARAEARRRILNTAYAAALSHRNSRVIVQNSDDLRFFHDQIRIGRERLVLIKGSGVDLDLFDPAARPSEPPLVVLPARMLVDKGVCEFVSAARLVRARGLTARFALVGGYDPENRAALSPSRIEELTGDGVVEYWGHRKDMATVMGQAQVVCLPSYREGLPKALLEGAAAGRALVTTNVPGCREVVRDGENGLLVPARDADALADALARLIADREMCSRMGLAARVFAEREFSLKSVIERSLDLYQELVA